VRLQGALAAALTPLTDGGESLDEPAFEPYVDFLVSGGVDGLLALGSTGEGILLPLAQRTRVAEAFIAAAAGRIQVAVHAGAQSTRETVALAAHAAEIGADAVAVIAPPYFRLDEPAIAAHFEAAARACDPTPFYVYEFESVSGYAIPLAVIERLRESAPNLAGMKVSDAPFAKVRPYLLDGLDVFVGAEALIHEAVTAGAIGAVSGLASAFPELVVAAVREPSVETAARAGEVRAVLERFPRHAALKAVVRERGVPLREDVSPPLRGLAVEERTELLEWLAATLTPA
jgi:dihydrodipicolinate synthase/N-acetylneuraminate lyase